MRRSIMQARRPGAVLVETAVVLPVVLLLLLGLLVGGMGVVRYQEVAHLAREGARYASTHAGRYAEDGQAKATGSPAIVTGADLFPTILAQAVALDPERLQVDVSWVAAGKYTPVNYPSFVDSDPALSPPGQKTITNYVTVTVTYEWSPEIYFVGPFTLTSTSKVPVSY